MLQTMNFHYPNFKIAAFLSLALALLILGLSFFFGKNEFFLLLNNDWGKTADFIFKYLTYLGDGWLWLVWVIVIVVFKKYRLLPFFISVVLLSTLFTQLGKHVIFPDELRPSLALAKNSTVHFVNGVTPLSLNSFPSGHTATAFCFALIIALLVPGRALMLISLAAALLVGYSRIYLGQHFPLDVAGGILVAVPSVYLSVLLQNRFERRKAMLNAKK
jgi:membrane-associated phospholipid phosphatase